MNTNKIKQLTRNNDHTSAYLEIAKMFELKYFISVFNAIKSIIEIERHLPNGVVQYRNTKLTEMLEWVKETQSEEIYKEVYSSI